MYILYVVYCIYCIYQSINASTCMCCICSNDLKLRKGDSYDFVNYRIYRISFSQKKSVDSSINQKTLEYF